uniref:CSON011900 protein n=1 Tax=Culicoides sonorensis TaxID=179676 RepID=A0A336KIF1_CULSO
MLDPDYPNFRKKSFCSDTSKKSRNKEPKKVRFTRVLGAAIRKFIIKAYHKTCFSIKKVFAEFCIFSSIHGIRHFYHSVWYQKLFFAISFCISIAACALIVRLIRFEWLDKPVILSYAVQPIPVSEIPFPAITVCPQVRASHRRFNCARDMSKFVSSLIVDQDLNEKYTTILRSFCERIAYTRGGAGGRGWINPIDVPLKKSFSHHLTEIALTEQELIDDCENNLSGNQNKTCKWSRIMNSDGVCYTFNTIDSKEMFNDGVAYQYESHGIKTMEKGTVNPEIQSNIYPYRSKGAGRNVKIRLKFDPKDLANVCIYDSHRGFNIYIHSPFDYPFSVYNMHRVSTNMKVNFEITPKMTITDDQLRATTASKRKCYFNNEVGLDFFQHYTQNNCELECYSKESLATCYCTEFWIPACNGTISNAYCWLQSAKVRMTDDQIRLSLDEHSICGCYPSCNSVEYEIDQIAISDNISKWYPDNEDGLEFTELTFQFKTFTFNMVKREELFTDLDFISNIGGLLSLFIGTSFLSLIELGFFFILRFIRHLQSDPVHINIELY